MGIEVFDRLHVLGRQRDQVAGASLQQVGRRQRVQLAVQIDAHHRQQSVRHIVRQERFHPVQEPCHRRGGEQQHDQQHRRRIRPHRGDDQRAEHADADEGDHPADAAGHGDGELPAPRTDEAQQRTDGLRPADRGGVLRQAVHHGGGVRHRCRIGRSKVADRSDRVTALGQLRSHQVAIRAVARDQLGMPAALRHRAVLQHQDAVGVDHAGQPVCQDQRGAAGHQPIEGLLDHRLVLRVHRGQRFVQHQDRRVAQQRAGDGDALALAARQPRAALADHRLVAIG